MLGNDYSAQPSMELNKFQTNQQDEALRLPDDTTRGSLSYVGKGGLL